MKTKKHITVLCGGQSTEHEISIVSASNVVAGLDRDKYHVSVIYISRQGGWYFLEELEEVREAKIQKTIAEQKAIPLLIKPGSPKQPWVFQNNSGQQISTDCVFPVLHGALGEDGAMQGLLEILNVPYVGANVLGSAICMEKHIAKRLLRFANLPTADWVRIDQESIDQYSYQQVADRLGDVVFVKPVSLGSSIGISKVKNQQQFDAAIRDAFQYDDQVIVEKCIVGREIECSVLGNSEAVASLPSEVISHYDFYSYEAKYLDPKGAETVSPADLPEAIVTQIQALSVETFKVLQCEGMARVDFFVTPEEEIFINEVNTIPGFTDISLYPKNWAVSGLAYSELLNDLIELAIARHHRKASLSHKLSRIEDHDRAERELPKEFE